MAVGDACCWVELQFTSGACIVGMGRVEKEARWCRYGWSRLIMYGAAAI